MFLKESVLVLQLSSIPWYVCSPSKGSFFFFFPLLGQERKGWHNKQLLWLTTIIQDPRTFSESVWDPVFASLNSHRNRLLLPGGVASGPAVLESILTFPDLVNSTTPSCFSVGNDFTFLWGDACSPLGMVLTGCSSSAFHSTLLNFPSRPFLLMPQGQISLQQARAKPIHRVKKEDWDIILEIEGEQSECHGMSAIPEAGLLTYGTPPLPFLLPWEPAGLCSLAPNGS